MALPRRTFNTTVLTQSTRLVGSHIATHGLCFGHFNRLCIHSESVRWKYESLNTKPVARLRDDVNQKLEHVSFTLDIIVLAALSWEAKMTDSNDVLVFAAI